METKSKLRILPKVKVKGQDFSKEKIVVVPNQSMSLQEILRRFVRRESLPISKEGTYDTRFGDLEKMQNLDITEKMEHVAKIKVFLKKGEELEELRAKGQSDPTPPPPPPPQPPVDTPPPKA